MPNHQQSEKAWVKSVLDRYEQIENLRPHAAEIEKLISDAPEWVLELWKHALKISHPGLKVKCAKKWKAKELGCLLGRQCALERVVFNEVPLSPRVRNEKKKWNRAKSKILKVCPDFAVAYETHPRELKDWRPLFKRFIDDVLAEARQRPYQQSSAFMEAFGKANMIKPDDLATDKVMGVGEKLAFVMILFWEYIAQFKSVAELHGFLQAVTKPHGITITLKRVEKLCQRIGLRFKGRGRPRKIQTNTQSSA